MVDDFLHVAISCRDLERSIRFYEGRPQVYGSMFDWDDAGELAPWPIGDADGVDRRREAVGLPPLAEQIESVRAAAASEGEPSPSDPAAQWTGAHKGHAFFAYATNYLIDTDHGVIVDVEATRAIRQAEVGAARPPAVRPASAPSP